MKFPDDIKEREQYILSRVQEGDFDLQWVPVTHIEAGKTIKLFVSSDVLKVHRVRVNVSATLSQQVCDLTGSMLLTPKIADIIYRNRDRTLEPLPQVITSRTDAMIEQSKKIDGLLGGTNELELKDTLGKYWVLSNKLSGDLAMNYGWHFADTSFQGMVGSSCASGLINSKNGAAFRVIQPPGLRHDRFHVDYSQVHRAVLKVCHLNGVETTLDKVFRDREHAFLVSHEGVLNVHRQSNVALPSDTVTVLPEVIVYDDRDDV
jgi:hypothetical protein